jgi:dihydrofolate reductase
MRLSLIAALDRNGLIGSEHGLPWRLPRDLRRFRDLTWGKPIIMGRTTHEHIGRPLPGRQNIVLSRSSGLAIPGCTGARSLDEALSLADASADECFVIGGSQVYREALPRADRLYLTLVDGIFEGNAWFPSDLMRPDEWSVEQREVCPADDKNPHPHVFLVLDRRRPKDPGERPSELNALSRSANAGYQPDV